MTSLEISPEKRFLLQPESDQGDSDYILLFCNPYDPTLYSKNAKYRDFEYTPDACSDYFCKVFRTNLSEITLERPWFPLLKELYRDLHLFLREKPTVQFHDFANFILTCVLKVLQEELQLSVKLFFSRDKDEILCKLKASEQNLKIQADISDYRLQLRAQVGETESYQSVPPFGAFESKAKPGFFSKETDSQEELFKHYNSKDQEVTEGGSLFQYKDRVRLILSMLESKLEISALRILGILKMEYCLHDLVQLQAFGKDWVTLRKFWNPMDIEKIRVYFGEEVGMYFSWIQAYVYWLIVPGVMGFVTFLVVCGTEGQLYSQEGGRTSNDALLAFALFLSIWSTLFTALWKRKESELAWKWGSLDLDSVETQRAEFIGKWEKDDVTGKMRKRREPGGWHKVRKVLSFSVVLMFVLLVLAAVIAIFLYRASLASDSSALQWTAFLNAIQIKVMNFLYTYVAKWLNDWENIESESIYYDSLSIKLFMFQFVNSYTSLLYIAFVKNSTEGCVHNNCMGELSIQLMIIFLTNLALNVVELGLPWAIAFYKDRSELRKVKRMREGGEDVRISMTFTEEQSKRFEYDTPLSDYMEIVIQYGYVVMFCAAFPLAPLLALILSVIEIRVDAWKLCNLEQRPYPDPVNSIGVWSPIILSVSILAAITNPAIIIFTAKTFNDYSSNSYWIIFLSFEHFLLLLHVVVQYLVATETTDVKLGKVWSDRVMKERLMHIESDTDKERENRDLNFSAPERRIMMELSLKDIKPDNY